MGRVSAIKEKRGCVDECPREILHAGETAVSRLAGAAIFGVGWGLSGFCPGGSIPMMGTFTAPVYVFTTTMLLGIFTARSLQHLAALRASHLKEA